MHQSKFSYLKDPHKSSVRYIFIPFIYYSSHYNYKLRYKPNQRCNTNNIFFDSLSFYSYILDYYACYCSKTLFSFALLFRPYFHIDCDYSNQNKHNLQYTFFQLKNTSNTS